ncbi:unnamed protein product [Phytophthora fragariaefolia]|uniref:Unnamed protein product n=1 Tax=Phytophthora fragariaefolia TaxID=1490495 RepID=A0A9W6YDZ1_9STRA|nr:unnamed protein product [Phytophthora fragariaefolia]
MGFKLRDPNELLKQYGVMEAGELTACSKMKARSNAKVVRRKQEQLWKWRRAKLLQPCLEAALNECDEQWAVRGLVSSRVSSWWKFDDGSVATHLGSTLWSMNASPWQYSRVEPVSSAQQDADGCLRGGLTSCSTQAESWKKVKTCNRLPQCDHGDQRQVGERGEVRRQMGPSQPQVQYPNGKQLSLRAEGSLRKSRCSRGEPDVLDRRTGSSQPEALNLDCEIFMKSAGGPAQVEAYPVDGDPTRRSIQPLPEEDVVVGDDEEEAAGTLRTREITETEDDVDDVEDAGSVTS